MRYRFEEQACVADALRKNATPGSNFVTKPCTYELLCKRTGQGPAAISLH